MFNFMLLGNRLWGLSKPEANNNQRVIGYIAWFPCNSHGSCYKLGRRQRSCQKHLEVKSEGLPDYNTSRAPPLRSEVDGLRLRSPKISWTTSHCKRTVITSCIVYYLLNQLSLIIFVVAVTVFPSLKNNPVTMTVILLPACYFTISTDWTIS